MLVWSRNPDLDNTITFVDDPMLTFNPEIWDLDYEMVWYIDKDYNPLDDDVWALKCKVKHTRLKGTKHMGYVTPEFPDPIIEFNPDFPELEKLEFDIDFEIPWYDLRYEHVWMLDSKHTKKDVSKSVWAIKIRYTNDIVGTKIVGAIGPTPIIEFNPDFPELEKLNLDIDPEIPWYDLRYEHVWMLDSKHTKKDVSKSVWAVKIRYTNDIIGTKVVGTIGPTPVIELNPELPELEFNIDPEIPWYDLGYEHVWMLDSKHTKTAPEPIWAVKIRYTNDIVGTKIVGSVSPVPRIEINPDVEFYDIDTTSIDVQYHDFEYTTTLMLDKKIAGNYDIWAVKINYVDQPVGYKVDWTVHPKQFIEYNDSLKHLNIKLEYEIPFHDSKYVHTWYLDKSCGLGDKVWAVKVYTSSRASGEKDMGIVTPIISDKLDVIFISYKEPNAEENWNRLLEKAPWAKRVDGVKGIFNAHRAAAELSSTDMFYVVDGDAYIVDEFDFNFQPNIFDRDCSYVWYSKNPVNGLVYENGGIKLFPKKEILKVKSWKTLDMFTGINIKIKVQDQISCLTKFNSNEFNTWRSAFRECVKLYKINKMTSLNKWLTKGKSKPFGKYAIDGATAGYQYAKENLNDTSAMLKINDYKWLQTEFNLYYNSKNNDR